MATVESVTLKLKNGGTLVLQGGKVFVKKNASSYGPIFMIAAVCMMIAKMTGHFPYSWWVVFAPIWGPPAIVIGCILAVVALIIGIVLVVLLGIGIAFGVAAFIDWRRDRKRRKKAQSSILRGDFR